MRLLIASALLLLFACKSSTEQTTTTNVPESSGSVELGVPEEISETARQAMAEGLMGDPSLFPYVYQEENNTNRFEAYEMRFQLTFDEQWYPMTNQQTPWLKPDAYDERTGNFVTYVRRGRELSLTNPYTAVQYIRRNMPYTSTIDSIYLWLDDTQLNRREGSIRQDAYTLETSSKVQAICKEYNIPASSDSTYDSKYIAYAYLPYNEEYFLGFALTCKEESDFETNQPLFYDLVRSFQYR
ncbi:MAG: hypothetical protein AAGM67_16175 [Bacteroidota bacterium]